MYSGNFVLCDIVTDIFHLAHIFLFGIEYCNCYWHVLKNKELWVVMFFSDALD